MSNRDAASQRATLGNNPRPRIAPYAEAPGAYQPVVRLQIPIMNPGEYLHGEIYVTGYGEIGPAKFFISSSPGVFDSSDCEVTDGFVKNGPLITFGGQTTKVNMDVGITLSIAGLKTEKWQSTTAFYDINQPEPGFENDLSRIGHLSTETHQRNPPASFSFKTRKTARAGDYGIQIVFSYFDGVEWRNSVLNVPFRLRSRLERWNSFLAWLAAMAGVATIAAAVLSTASGIDSTISTMKKWLNPEPSATVHPAATQKKP